MQPCFTGPNLIPAATLSCGTAAPAMGVSNLATQHAWQKWRSLSGTDWFSWDNGTAKMHQVFWLKNVSWGAGAQVRVRLSDTARDTGDLYDSQLETAGYLLTDSGLIITTEGGDGLLLGDGGIVNLAANVDALARQWLLVLALPIAARYGQIDIIGGGGVTYLDTGIAHVGGVYRMGRYEDYNAAPHADDLSGIVETPSGASFIDPRGLRRLRGFSVSNISEAEYFQSLMPVLAAGASSNLGYIPRPGHPFQNAEAIYGLLQPGWAAQVTSNKRWSFAGQIKERL